jgi:hypothetical protein
MKKSTGFAAGCQWQGPEAYRERRYTPGERTEFVRFAEIEKNIDWD